jgi:hypothetical protein
MVKINISIEGEELSDILDELLDMGVEFTETNREKIRELLKIVAHEAIDVLLERKILEKGATLYRKINSEINWSYKQDHRKSNL